MKNQKNKPQPELVSTVEDAAVAYGPSPVPMPITHVRGLGERFDLTVGDLAAILDVTPKTLHRWTAQQTALSPQQTDRIEILESIFRLGARVLGTHAAVSAWMGEPVLLLGGRKPRDLLKTESGRRAVESALRQIELGLF